ncbi:MULTISPECIES: hypothetical protein, partial [Megasphaera]
MNKAIIPLFLLLSTPLPLLAAATPAAMQEEQAQHSFPSLRERMNLRQELAIEQTKKTPATPVYEYNIHPAPAIADRFNTAPHPVPTGTAASTRPLRADAGLAGERGVQGRRDDKQETTSRSAVMKAPRKRRKTVRIPKSPREQEKRPIMQPEKSPKRLSKKGLMQKRRRPRPASKRLKWEPTLPEKYWVGCSDRYKKGRLL